MNITIDKQSRMPVYQQIKHQITALVHKGLLEGGAKLPSVRQLAKSLGVTKNTVVTAYEELAAENIIEPRPGSGMYVTNNVNAATGVSLDARADMSGALADAPPMTWEPFEFQSSFFGMPPAKRGKPVIKLTQASPDPKLFPFARIKQVASNMLWSPKEFFFDRGNPQGFQPLEEHLEKEMALAGIPMAEGQNDIIITAGFRRALSLILDYIVRPGQKVVVESPCFTGVLNLLIAKRIDYVAVPVDNEGMDTEYLATVLQQGGVAAVITIPTFHNPTGVTLSRERREHLMLLAVRHRVPIIEDDWGRLLRYEGPSMPSLKSIDPGGYVVHIGTYSKIFLPGMRLGWVTCPAKIGVPLVRAKLAADSSDSLFLQALMYDLIVRGHLAKHLRATQKEYNARRNAMCGVLARELPEQCSFNRPLGGFCVWVKLPENIFSMPLLALAREAGVDFLPSAFVNPGRRDGNALRLSFSRNSVEDIRNGTSILCSVIRDAIDNPGRIENMDMTYEELYK
jgi:GntR family transcriptional regulator/MocR family aminotransferase